MDYSTQAFERLYKDNYPLMYRMAYSMVMDQEDARDVVSQVFALVWQRKPEIQMGAVRGYLLTATRNQCLNVLQHREQRQTMAEELQREAQGPNGDKQHDRLISELHRVIQEQLTEQDRRVLALHYDQQLSYAETAQQLGISPSAVNKHVTQSLTKLRKFLKI